MGMHSSPPSLSSPEGILMGSIKPQHTVALSRQQCPSLTRELHQHLNNVDAGFLNAAEDSCRHLTHAALPRHVPQKGTTCCTPAYSKILGLLESHTQYYALAPQNGHAPSTPPSTCRAIPGSVNLPFVGTRSHAYSCTTHIIVNQHATVMKFPRVFNRGDENAC